MGGWLDEAAGAVAHGFGAPVLAEALGQREVQKVSRLHQGAEREAVEESPLHRGSREAAEIVAGQVYAGHPELFKGICLDLLLLL